MVNKEPNIQLLIEGCRNKKRHAQKKLYQLFFSYAMSVSLLYSTNREEAEEILNESFLKVYTKIDQYDEHYAFKKWFRTILINTAIDYARKYKKLQLFTTEMEQIRSFERNGLDNLIYEDILKNIQLLTPQYRLVFILYAIEGYKHHEIATRLNISVGTSKSNYSKAKRNLQHNFKKSVEAKKLKNGR